MAVLFVLIQFRCSDTVFYLWVSLDSDMLSAWFLFHRPSSVTEEVSASLLPWQIHWTSAGLQGNGSPRAGGLPDAGARLPCVVRERHQMGWGFPVTAGLPYLRVCTEALAIAVFQICLQHCNLGLCRRQTHLAEAERKSRPARLRATLCPWALKKIQQQARYTVQQHLKWNSYFSAGLGC